MHIGNFFNKFFVRSLVSVVPASLALSSFAFASILPPNDLDLEDDLNFAPNMTEQEFNSIVNGIVSQYAPLVKSLGGTLKSNNLWKDSTVNASANRTGSTWMINMYGGLARRPEVTPDGFALVVCHELGHHLGGFAFKGSSWAANEGQSDYFATQACARKIWSSEKSKNAASRSEAGSTEINKCEKAWKSADEQNLCIRTAVAGKSLGTLLSALKNGKPPSYEISDKAVVSRTADSHPAAQCRLDTYLAGALCPVAFSKDSIPGFKERTAFGNAAETAALKFSCSPVGEFSFAARPTCWFAPKVK